MNQETMKQIEGYEDVLMEIEIAEKLGNDKTIDKGEVKEYIDRLHPSEIEMKVNEIRDETQSAKTLRLIPENGYLPPFQAGQYIPVFLEVGGIRTSRPYSISSPPNHTGYYDITVRRVENGLVSSYLLDEVKNGDRIICSGPTGNFHHNPVIHDN